MKISREEFLRKLEAIQPGTDQGMPTIDQSNCFVFYEGMIGAFNSDICCRVESGLGPDITGAVRAEKALKLLHGFGDDNPDVSLEGGRLYFKGKRRERGYLNIESRISDEIQSVPLPHDFKPIHPQFGEAVGIVSNCAGTDKNKFWTTCVHIHPRWVEACDDIRACRWKFHPKDTFTQPGSGIDNPVVVKKIAIKHVASAGVTELSEEHSPGWIHFRTPGGMIFSCQSFIEPYEDLTDFLKFDGKTVVFPPGLEEICKTAQIFSSEFAKRDLVRVELSQGEVLVAADGITGGYQKPRKVEYNGPDLIFYISPEILGHVVGKYPQATVVPGKLRVKTDNYVFATQLGLPEEEQSQDDTPFTQGEDIPQRTFRDKVKSDYEHALSNGEEEDD